MNFGLDKIHANFGLDRTHANLDLMSSTVNINNPYDTQQLCTLTSLTGRKKQYYIHHYKPKSQLLNDDKYLHDMFNLEPDNETLRCNCVSITLYIKNNNIQMLTGYLISINRTISNVANNLPDWIVRLYIDSTVFDLLDKDFSLDDNYNPATIVRIQQLCSQLYQQISNSDNVEIYTITCPSPVNNNLDEQGTNTDETTQKKELEKTRIYRFLPLLDNIENDVEEGNVNGVKYGTNVCVVREADGFVSQLDCHNIKCFAANDKVVYLIPMFYETAHTYDHNNYTYKSYSFWLTKYKKYFDGEFFSQYNNLYDLLAGVIAVKYKIKSQYFYDTIQVVLNRQNEQVDARHPTTFDEELLLELFKHVISAKIIPKSTHKFTHDDSIEYDNREYEYILNNIIYERHNIEMIYYDSLDGDEPYIRKLVDMGILLLDEQQIIELADAVTSITTNIIQTCYEQGIHNPTSSYITFFVLDLIFNVKYMNPSNNTLYNVTFDNNRPDFIPYGRSEPNTIYEREHSIYNKENNILAFVNKPYYGGDIRKFTVTNNALTVINLFDSAYDEIMSLPLPLP